MRTTVLAALPIALVTVLGAGLRLFLLDDKSFWGDEMNMLWCMTGERDIAKSSGNALGFMEILRLLSNFGTSDFLYRLPAALAGVATIPLLYKTGKVLFDHRIGLIAAFLLAIAPTHVALSQQVHSYTLFCFLTLLSFHLLWRAHHERSVLTWLAFAVVHGVSMYMHLYTVFVLVTEALVLMLLLAKSEQRRRRLTRRNLAVLAAVSGIMILLSIPILNDWILPLGSQLVSKIGGEDSTVKTFQRTPKFELGPKIFGKAFKQLANGKVVGFTWVAQVCLVVFLVGIGKLLVNWRVQGMSLLMMIFVPVFPIAIFSHVSNIDFGSRRLIFILPMLILCVSAGIVGISDFMRRILKDLGCVAPRWAFDTVLAAALGLLVMSTTLESYYTRMEHGDVKRLARLLELEAREGDLIVAWRPEHIRFYYKGPLEIRNVARMMKRVSSTYQESNRIWYIRARNVANWPKFQDLESWVHGLDPLVFRMGGGLEILFKNSQPASHEAMLQERVGILETAVELKPKRPYLRTNLAWAYMATGDKKAAQEQRKIASELRK